MRAVGRWKAGAINEDTGAVFFTPHGRMDCFYPRQGAFTPRYLKLDATFTFSASGINSTLELYICRFGTRLRPLCWDSRWTEFK